MARRNLWRSLATVSLLLVSSAAAGLVAAPPANAAQANIWTITVRDDGFSVQNLTVQKDDVLIFQLDANAVQAHTLTWVEGGLSWDFRRRPWAKYGGPFGATGVTLHFYDSAEIPGYDAASTFAGTLTINDTPPPPPTTTTVPAPVTTSTVPRSTTTTAPPTTTTTTDGSIHPLLVGDPGATTTTWAPVALPVTNAAAKAAAAPATTAPAKDKTPAKAKDGPASTTTTAPPAPPAGLFDTSTLTPAAPTPDPSPAAVTGLGNSADVQSALAGILHPDKPADTGASLLLLACGGIAALLLLGGGWAWFHRSSRYFPA